MKNCFQNLLLEVDARAKAHEPRSREKGRLRYLLEDSRALGLLSTNWGFSQVLCQPHNMDVRFQVS